MKAKEKCERRSMGKQKKGLKRLKDNILRSALRREEGLDGILVTVGLCIIALLLCVVMKDSLASFIQTIVTALETRANSILMGG